MPAADDERDFAVSKKLRAIDLYSGVGGWSLGLGMAGVEVAASYEIWNQAHRTNGYNNGHESTVTDIRALTVDSLPSAIDIVVGSPPCTQFSFANRGGSGDIDDGLVDVSKFLAVVEATQPRYWAMENVPRLAAIMKKELEKGGRLWRFRHLAPEIHVVDACKWGVPQRRLRCIAGKLPFNLLFDYAACTPRRQLGDVVRAFQGSTVVDPIYGISLPKEHLWDHEPEEVLSAEEERMNREMKTFHPVYNNMAFPDNERRPARTVTATCTRVSRESIVIAAPESRHGFRRLTVRERASLQSFPITYQFYGDTHAQKLKMVGNAVPPLLTFYIAQAMLGTEPSDLAAPSDAVKRFCPSVVRPKKTAPDAAGGCYPADRRFRAAIPHLRFKSGVRFEFGNTFDKGNPVWRVRFFFGSSKNIAELSLDAKLQKQIAARRGVGKYVVLAKKLLGGRESLVTKCNAYQLQEVWAHRHADGIHPYRIVDELGASAAELRQAVASNSSIARTTMESILGTLGSPKGSEKVIRNAESVFAGVLVGCAINELLESPKFQIKRRAAQRHLVFADE